MKAVLGILVLAACGGGSDDPPADSPAGDAPSSAIMAVSPCTGEAATVMTLETRFEPPNTTISNGQIVKFVTEATHPIVPNTGTDAALTVGEAQTKCFRFTAPGTYGFRCPNHGLAGTIVVN